jgi:hypothetical protein
MVESLRVGRGKERRQGYSFEIVLLHPGPEPDEV